MGNIAQCPGTSARPESWDMWRREKHLTSLTHYLKKENWCAVSDKKGRYTRVLSYKEV